eukprot:CAMPEP_0174275624 /NCGR_PEP_ID=MMETSP0439-20130205/59931_1 /TAXON_ID=0 /ORGANISM="Stereomyxa ramosa, Strain Chinc5" /LENGTH=384 /DNA_ID=CAMNT_0015367753 /DNA_START=1013 /DNA_END=2167 /DNA_ORIENTATION=-
MRIQPNYSNELFVRISSGGKLYTDPRVTLKMNLDVETGGQAILRGRIPHDITLAPNSSLVGEVYLHRVDFSFPLWDVRLTEILDIDAGGLVSLMALVLGATTPHMYHSLCQTVLASCPEKEATRPLRSELEEFLETNREDCEASRNLAASKFRALPPIGDDHDGHILSRYMQKINSFFSGFSPKEDRPNNNSSVTNDEDGSDGAISDAYDLRQYEEVMVKCLFLLVDQLSSSLPSREIRHDSGMVSYSNVPVDLKTITRVMLLLLNSIKDKTGKKDELLVWKYTALTNILGLFHKLFTTVLQGQSNRFRKFVIEDVQTFLQDNWGDVDNLPGSDASSPTLKAQILLFVTLTKELSAEDFSTNPFFSSATSLHWDDGTKRYVIKE